MRKWNFENGITVEEEENNYSLHKFVVYNNDELLGTIYPETEEDMEACAEMMDEGTDPITGGWEDGMGNQCSISGWGER